MTGTVEALRVWVETNAPWIALSLFLAFVAAMRLRTVRRRRRRRGRTGPPRRSWRPPYDPGSAAEDGEGPDGDPE